MAELAPDSPILDYQGLGQQLPELSSLGRPVTIVMKIKYMRKVSIEQLAAQENTGQSNGG